MAFTKQNRIKMFLNSVGKINELFEKISVSLRGVKDHYELCGELEQQQNGGEEGVESSTFCYLVRCPKSVRLEETSFLRLMIAMSLYLKKISAVLPITTTVDVRSVAPLLVLSRVLKLHNIILICA